MKQSLLAILMATRKKPEIRQGYILDTTRRSVPNIYLWGYGLCGEKTYDMFASKSVS